MSLTPAERETTIQVDDESNKWILTTFQGKIRTKLRKAEVHPIKLLEDDGAVYELDFEQVSFRKKSRGRKMTQEQKDAARIRLAEARLAKQEANKE